MPTVWAIERGEYSDYHIVGVFSSHENAKLMAAVIEANESDIVEWTLDPAIDQLRQGLCCYYILMFSNGDVQHCYVSMPMDEPLPPLRIYTCDLRGVDEAAMWIYVWADSKKAAIKIANEKRLQLIAMNKFTEETAHETQD